MTTTSIRCPHCLFTQELNVGDITYPTSGQLQCVSCKKLIHFEIICIVGKTQNEKSKNLIEYFEGF